MQIASTAQKTLQQISEYVKSSHLLSDLDFKLNICNKCLNVVFPAFKDYELAIDNSSAFFSALLKITGETNLVIEDVELFKENLSMGRYPAVFLRSL